MTIYSHRSIPGEQPSGTIFEASLFPNYPVLADIKQQMYAEGAIYASMSGSGSTVYGIFDAPVICPNQFSDYSVWQGKL